MFFAGGGGIPFGFQGGGGRGHPGMQFGGFEGFEGGGFPGGGRGKGGGKVAESGLARTLLAKARRPGILVYPPTNTLGTFYYYHYH